MTSLRAVLGRCALTLALALPLAAAGQSAAPPPAAASDNGLSLRPAMGWSSWSFVRRWPTEAKMKAQADALAASGLKDKGYIHVNLDDFYQKCDANGFEVDSYGRWAVDPAKFPSGIKALADYIHAKGLKFGFYVTPGIAKNAVTRNTPIEGTPYRARDIADTTRQEKNYNCKNMYYIDYGKPGAQEFVNSWARQFADWGVDYLKIDGVGSHDIPDVAAWDRALRATGRPITYALSNNLAIADAPTWRRLANSWRTQGDVECYCGPGPNGSGFPLTNWGKITSRFTSAANWQPYAGPGGWNDLDSLQIGNGDQIGLTADQRRSHMTLWAMAASPLLIGSDLTQLNATDVSILGNERLIAVNQDGIAARRIVDSGSQQVWHKRRPGGDHVIALFNTGTSGNQTVSVSWSQAGISGPAEITDLWSGRTTGTVDGSYSAVLRPGETRLIRAVPGGAGAVRYEAENATYTAGSTVDSNHGGFSGTGFVNTPNAVGAYVEWKVPASIAGDATITLRYANGTTTGRPMDLSVNGSVVAPDRAFDGTGAWTTWSDVTLTVPLKAGDNTVRATATTANGAPNLDYLDRG
ncbi:CBM35 domain-containing protein [Streptomyces yaizuensis]|uniref:Alpha-galactosidase n=1 Tax=Streptomyces yaizuensis TaxID=2989713 RepID=A0ABQ5P6V2_9ACTN|nr:CBM35 domain-containing protein [Streptomyces sp. YSPA8]GLF98314.1 carbohydrate-binding protein [Streptomyces sp. YSPA8]